MAQTTALRLSAKPSLRLSKPTKRPPRNGAKPGTSFATATPVESAIQLACDRTSLRGSSRARALRFLLLGKAGTCARRAVRGTAGRSSTGGATARGPLLR
eukprot:2793135-Alexandrium_andersonii.AAC.1